MAFQAKIRFRGLFQPLRNRIPITINLKFLETAVELVIRLGTESRTGLGELSFASPIPWLSVQVILFHVRHLRESNKGPPI